MGSLWVKGQSGNSAGKPKGTRSAADVITPRDPATGRLLPGAKLGKGRVLGSKNNETLLGEHLWKVGLVGKIEKAISVLMQQLEDETANPFIRQGAARILLDWHSKSTLSLDSFLTKQELKKVAIRAAEAFQQTEDTRKLEYAQALVRLSLSKLRSKEKKS